MHYTYKYIYIPICQFFVPFRPLILCFLFSFFMISHTILLSMFNCCLLICLFCRRSPPSHYKKNIINTHRMLRMSYRELSMVVHWRAECEPHSGRAHDPCALIRDEQRCTGKYVAAFKNASSDSLGWCLNKCRYYCNLKKEEKKLSTWLRHWPQVPDLDRNENIYLLYICLSSINIHSM